MIQVEVKTGQGILYGSYSGGPYIELAFGLKEKPIEVINVFDYEKSQPRIQANYEVVLSVISEWLEDHDEYDLKQYFHRQLLN